MKNKSKQKWILFAIFMFVELFLAVSKLGIIQLDKLSITIMQIPIIIGTIILGLPQGLALAGVFGFSTMIQSMSYPPESIDASFQNPLVSVTSRLMIPIVVWLISKGINKIANDDTPSGHIICSGLTAIFGSLSNTVFVTLALLIFAPEKLGVSNGLAASAIFVTNIVGVNAIIEVFLSVVVTSIFVPIIYLICQGRGAKRIDTPVSKTFHKWLLVFVALGFFVVSILFYGVQMHQNVNGARKFMIEKYEDIIETVDENGNIKTSVNWTLGESGAIIIANNKEIVFASNSDLLGQTLPQYKQKNLEKSDNGYFHTDYYGISGIGIIKNYDGYDIFLFMPDSEVYEGRDAFAAMLLTALGILFLLMYIGISNLVESKVVNKIKDVNASLNEIQKGDLDKKVEVSGNTEFVELSSGINSTVEALKKSTNEIVERIKHEMIFARTIQLSSLPSSLQMKTHKDSIDLYASMNPAKEVGGDFYDYYMIDDDHLAFLVADVSGKGISAAMFMMKSKTLIKSNAEQGLPIDEVFTLTNEELCKNNDAEMFVTCWMGILDLSTLELEYTSAGHNPPLIRHSGGDYEFAKIKPDFVLGGMSGIKYKKHMVSLNKNDEIFLYTDGVTEATNIREQLYGDDRLRDELNSIKDKNAKEICQAVFDSTIKFTGNAPQFDDVTTLSLRLINND